MDESDLSFNFDTNGWDLDFRSLLTPTRGVSPYIYLQDKLFESPDKKYACLFYTITEFRMGAYAGLVAIFKNKGNPTLVLNPKDQWFIYQGENSVVFFDHRAFVRMLGCNQDENLSGNPFVIFDLDKNRFGFIDFDWSSIYYSILKVSDTIFEFYPKDPDQLKRLASTRSKEQFDISSIKYYPLDKIGSLTALYLDEKKASIDRKNA